MRRRLGGILFLLLAVAGCRTPPEAGPAAQQPVEPERPPTGWRAVALAEDRLRIDRLDQLWASALDLARARGMGRQLRGEGELLDPHAGLPQAMPPPGPYRCRLLRFGGRRGLTAYRAYFCDVAVEGEQLSLTKQEGAERPGGYLWPEDGSRMIFLGAVAQGGEPVPPGYGEDRSRDLIGLVERIGPFRYRMVMPEPPSGAMLDVLELVAFVPDAE